MGPEKLTIEFLQAKGITEMPERGIQTVTVPGAVEGWTKLLQRFGRLKFPECWRQPFAMRKTVSGAGTGGARLAGERAVSRANENSKKTYLPNGRAPQMGEVFRNPDLAWSFG